MHHTKLIDKLVRELSYRVGVPNIHNKEHQSIMSEILSEWGEYDAKQRIFEFLTEEPRKFKNPILNRTIKYRDKNGKDKEGILGNLLTTKKDSPGRIAAEKALPGEGTPERDAINKEVGSQGTQKKIDSPKGDSTNTTDDTKETPTTGNALKPGSDYAKDAQDLVDRVKGKKDKKNSSDAPLSAKERKEIKRKKNIENADREREIEKLKKSPLTATFNTFGEGLKSELSKEPVQLNSLREIHNKTVELRAGGIAGAGGAKASEGESKYTEITTQMKKGLDGNSEHDEFKRNNQEEILKQKENFKNNKILKDDRDTLDQLGFKKDENGKYSDEAHEYLAVREVWSRKELEKIRKDKNSVFYKGGAAGFGGDDDAYIAWMKAAYDGGVSTQAFLETSKLDTTKDYQATQSTPELDGVVETTLKSKYDEHKEKCGSGTDESCKKAEHYATELAKWDKFKSYHDTYVIGQDKDGNMVYIPISNKKGSNMKDPQNNTTPAQRFSTIKKLFGEKIAKKVGNTLDTAIDEVSRVKATTIESTAKLEITPKIVETFESDKFKKYRKDLDDQATGRAKPKKNQELGKKRPFGQWLDTQNPPIDEEKWNSLSSKEKLELSQNYSKEKLFDGETSRIRYDDDGNMMYKDSDGKEKKISGLGALGLRYDTFGKLGIKFGEFKASDEAIALKKREDEVVTKTHTDVVNSFIEEDEPDGYHPENNPDADNGKTTQGYITGVLSAMHADTYIDMEDDEDYDVLIQMGVNGVRPSHIRTCLAEQSGFKGDVNASGGRKALKEHLAKRCRIEPGGKKVMVMSEGKSAELFNDVWRTAGAGQQKVASHFGKGMIDCMTEKVKKVDA
jgi:hypothetical protein